MAKKQITALQVLTMMDQIYRETKYPNARYVVGTKYTEKNANDIEKSIERFASIVGFLAERTKTQGRRMEAVQIETAFGKVTTQKAKFVTSTSRKGSSDMKILIPGIGYIACEIKYGKDTQSDVQKKYQQDVEKSGGIYIIIKTFEEFLIWYVKLKGRPAIMDQAIKKLIGV